MTVVVYGDFSCPFSLLASLRIDSLIESGHDIEFRAVEHASHLPVVGRRLDDAGKAELAAEMDEVRALLMPGEEFPEKVPASLVNTRAAVSGYAEAFGIGVGDEVRRLLFDAYWTKGLDIGSPEVLRSLLASTIKKGGAKQGRATSFSLREAGYAVSTNRGPITVEAYHRIGSWRESWLAITQTIPTLTVGRTDHIGIDALTWLAGGNAHPAVPNAAA